MALNKRLTGLVHLGGRLLEAKMKQIALTPQRSGSGRLVVDAAAEKFNLRLLVETTAVGTPPCTP